MAIEHPDGIISARRGKPRRLGQVVSCRMDAALLADIRQLAEADGILPSTWIRNAAAVAVFDRQKPQSVPGYRAIGWQCPHLTITAGSMTLGRVTSGCGCDMQPVYEPILRAV